MSNQQKAIAILVAILSAGWLIPLWLGVSTYLEFWRLEAWPFLVGQRPLNSFPFLAFSRSCFAVSFIWLGMVIATWAYVAFNALVSRRAA